VTEFYRVRVTLDQALSDQDMEKLRARLGGIAHSSTDPGPAMWVPADALVALGVVNVSNGSSRFMYGCIDVVIETASGGACGALAVIAHFIDDVVGNEFSRDLQVNRIAIGRP
jgi:hypothetical protein